MAKVYIVEDNDDMRFILKRALKRKVSNITIIGESETAENALFEIPSLQPDIVLVDISLPAMNGIDLIHHIRAKIQSAFILILTAHQIEHYTQKALEAGADGILSKNDTDELIEIVRGIQKQRGESV